ncbi:Protein RKD4 [Porphyridium purpureum]|uniref:Protein RKD4 n=1 Tax=Porphyridium purpureum TaxID=35688 RepID=A0A5J4Z269_PORPP|nr:Protein RKD4 [Porphyridium purpureum]|eukprot:POR1200..scf208_2
MADVSVPRGMVGGGSGDGIEVQKVARTFSLPIPQAAEELGVCVTILKRWCREWNISRWPFRRYKSLDHLMARLHSKTNELSQAEIQLQAQLIENRKQELTDKLLQTILRADAATAARGSSVKPVAPRLLASPEFRQSVEDAVAAQEGRVASSSAPVHQAEASPFQQPYPQQQQQPHPHLGTMHLQEQQEQQQQQRQYQQQHNHNNHHLNLMVQHHQQQLSMVQQMQQLQQEIQQQMHHSSPGQSLQQGQGMEGPSAMLSSTEKGDTTQPRHSARGTTSADVPIANAYTHPRSVSPSFPVFGDSELEYAGLGSGAPSGTSKYVHRDAYGRAAAQFVSGNPGDVFDAPVRSAGPRIRSHHQHRPQQHPPHAYKQSASPSPQLHHHQQAYSLTGMPLQPSSGAGYMESPSGMAGMNAGWLYSEMPMMGLGILSPPSMSWAPNPSANSMLNMPGSSSTGGLPPVDSHQQGYARHNGKPETSRMHSAMLASRYADYSPCTEFGSPSINNPQTSPSAWTRQSSGVSPMFRDVSVRDHAHAFAVPSHQQVMDMDISEKQKAGVSAVGHTANAEAPAVPVGESRATKIGEVKEDKPTSSSKPTNESMKQKAESSGPTRIGQQHQQGLGRLEEHSEEQRVAQQQPQAQQHKESQPSSAVATKTTQVEAATKQQVSHSVHDKQAHRPKEEEKVKLKKQHQHGHSQQHQQQQQDSKPSSPQEQPSSDPESKNSRAGSGEACGGSGGSGNGSAGSNAEAAPNDPFGAFSANGSGNGSTRDGSAGGGSAGDGSSGPITSDGSDEFGKTGKKRDNETTQQQRQGMGFNAAQEQHPNNRRVRKRARTQSATASPPHSPDDTHFNLICSSVGAVIFSTDFFFRVISCAGPDTIPALHGMPPRVGESLLDVLQVSPSTIGPDGNTTGANSATNATAKDTGALGLNHASDESRSTRHSDQNSENNSAAVQNMLNMYMDARAGRNVDHIYNHNNKQYLQLLRPLRASSGELIGTSNLCLDITSSSLSSIMH